MITLIFLSFAFIHSITVSQRFKQLCLRMLGKTFMQVWYRFLYNAISVMTIAGAFYLIYQAPDKTLWTGPLWFRWCMHFIQLSGLIFGARAFEHLDSAEFMGFKQVWRYFTGRETAGSIEGLTQRELVTTGVYGIVRHPLYLAGIIIFTFDPNITVNGLTITISCRPLLSLRLVHRRAPLHQGLRRSVPGISRTGAEVGAVLLMVYFYL